MSGAPISFPITILALMAAQRLGAIAHHNHGSFPFVNMTDDLSVAITPAGLSHHPGPGPADGRRVRLGLIAACRAAQREDRVNTDKNARPTGGDPAAAAAELRGATDPLPAPSPAGGDGGQRDGSAPAPRSSARHSPSTANGTAVHGESAPGAPTPGRSGSGAAEEAGATPRLEMTRGDRGTWRLPR